MITESEVETEKKSTAKEKCFTMSKIPQEVWKGEVLASGG